MTLNVFGVSVQPNSEQRKLDAWCACRVLPNYSPAIWRHDCNGRVIRFSDYGNRSSEYGGELDHVVAGALGGSDHSSNIRALHWRDNASHGGMLAAVLRNNITGNR